MLAEILSEETIDRLIQLKDNEFSNSFEIGDIANETVARARANNQPVTREQIFIDIGRVLGKTRSQVERYADMAAFFMPEIRRKYEVLPFSHFDLAMNLAQKETGAIHWQKLLDYDLDYMSQYGLPPSTAKLMTAYTWANKKEEIGGGGGKTMPDFDTLNEAHYKATHEEPDTAVEIKPTNLGERDPDEFYELVQQIENHLTPLPPLLERAREFVRDKYPGLDNTLHDMDKAIALLSGARQVMKTWDNKKGLY